MYLRNIYWDSENVHYLNCSFMEKSSTNDVFKHFDSCIESIDKTKLLRAFSGGPNVNLAFLNILGQNRSDAELNPL